MRLDLQTISKLLVLGLCCVVVSLGTAKQGWAELPSNKSPSNEEPSVASDQLPEVEIDFSRDVQPILAKRCFSCHGPDGAEGGLRLHELESALLELDSGSHAIVPGDPDGSVLLDRVMSSEEFERMPPEGKPLTETEIDLLRKWIAAGAPWQDYWAFESPKPQTPPEVDNTKWVKNPIDQFILHQLEASGFKPNPPADKATLIRRAYYDLTGLPPSVEEIEAFVQNDDPQAYEQVIDQLLASPRYGERWARHWLDLVRFAETNSFERDGVKPNAWKYRDYVIRSLNADKPYDQFVREQLAGDELPEVTDDSIIATGYYRLGLWDDEPADKKQALYDEFDDLIATTSQVFLGLTIQCARCHDHKIDPIPQTDYYKMLAIFHEVGSYAGKNQSDLSAPDLKEKYAQRDQKISELEAEIHAIEQRGIVKMPGEDQRTTEGSGRAKLLKQKLQQFLTDEDWQQYQALQKDLRQVRQEKLPPRDLALSVATVDPSVETYLMERGNPHTPGDRVYPGLPKLFGEIDFQPEKLPEGRKSSGYRLALANWIASPENKMTSRVMANRIWQHHFGRGIVPSSNNFGQLGDLPTHPELLDWLAAEFVAQGWRLKPMHKLMMMSNAYQMSSQAEPAALARDPQNLLFWRYDMRRLSAEEIRDSIFAATGKLNLKMYGPGFYPEISAEVMAGQSKPGDGWGKSSDEEQARRSVYIHVKRSLITPILADFDSPETDSSCAVRFATTQPSQALGMINGKFMQEQAEQLAQRVLLEAGAEASAHQRVQTALKLALSREPAEASVARGVEFIESWQDRYNLDAPTALKYYCLVVLNLNEFVYLD